ncbi:Protein of unknown function [Pyronema omphalodes CBS 100304]|uniref:Uncharacterized protein n=1 Tax=Pyronema omphalodes (strain CBS 100304) TaxID=1076935 RepID=U4LDZ6_PYROM|nr:Protein of unknown function [Pyronema omphalodes CBS 100304]
MYIIHNPAFMRRHYPRTFTPIFITFLEFSYVLAISKRLSIRTREPYHHQYGRYYYPGQHASHNTPRGNYPWQLKQGHMVIRLLRGEPLLLQCVLPSS